MGDDLEPTIANLPVMNRNRVLQQKDDSVLIFEIQVVVDDASNQHNEDILHGSHLPLDHKDRPEQPSTFFGTMVGRTIPRHLNLLHAKRVRVNGEKKNPNP